MELRIGYPKVKRLVIKQNSKNSHIVYWKLFNNDDEIELSHSWNYYLSIKKSDSTKVVAKAELEVIDNETYITLTMPIQSLTSSGLNKCELLVMDGDTTIYSPTFYLYVEPNVLDGTEIISEDDISSLDEIVRHIEDDYAIATEKTDGIVDLYDKYDLEFDEIIGVMSNETTRQNNETIRQSNEATRQSNEQNRQTGTSTAITNANTATDRANEAAQRCEDVLDHALQLKISEAEPEEQALDFLWWQPYGEYVDNNTYLNELGKLENLSRYIKTIEIIREQEMG